MVTATSLFAQRDKLAEVARAYNAKDYDKAKELIDEVTVHPETSNLAITWLYRGFIYKDYYKTKEFPDKRATSRIEALESLKKYLEMNEEDGNRKDATISYKYLAYSLHNDAANSLNPTEYKLAIENFEKYKRYISFIKEEIDYDLTEQEIQFHLVLGSVYSRIYESDQKANKVFFNKIKNSYLYVIELNPNNYSGHYNLGILYYNESVNIIKNLDYETELMTLDLIQDECVALFRKSLPYMQKAYELNPKRKDVLVGLSGIYFSLNELEKSEAIKKELNILQQD